MRKLERELYITLAWIVFLIAVGPVLILIFPIPPDQMIGALVLYAFCLFLAAIGYIRSLAPKLADWGRTPLVTEEYVRSKRTKSTSNQQGGGSTSYYITVGVLPEFDEFEVDRKDYDTVGKGDKIRLAYYPNSRIVEEIRLLWETSSMSD